MYVCKLQALPCYSKWKMQIFFFVKPVSVFCLVYHWKCIQLSPFVFLDCFIAILLTSKASFTQKTSFLLSFLFFLCLHVIKSTKLESSTRLFVTSQRTLPLVAQIDVSANWNFCVSTSKVLLFDAVFFPLNLCAFFQT